MRTESDIARGPLTGSIALIMGIILVGIIKTYNGRPEYTNIIYLSLLLYIITIVIIALVLYSGLITKMRCEIFSRNKEYGEYEEAESQDYTDLEALNDDKDYCSYCNKEINDSWDICLHCGKDLEDKARFKFLKTHNKIIGALFLVFLVISVGSMIWIRSGYDPATKEVNNLITKCDEEINTYIEVFPTYNEKVDNIYYELSLIQLNVNASDEDIENTLIQFDKTAQEQYSGIIKTQDELEFHLKSAKSKLEEANGLPMQEWQKAAIELKIQSIDKSIEGHNVFNEALYSEVFVYRKSYLNLDAARFYCIKAITEENKNGTFHELIEYEKSSIDYFSMGVMRIYEVNKVVRLNSSKKAISYIRCKNANNLKRIEYLKFVEKLEYRKASEYTANVEYEKCQLFNFKDIYEELNDWHESNTNSLYNTSYDLINESRILWEKAESLIYQK